MPKLVQGSLVATGLKIAIIAARWNDFFGESMVKGAIETVARHGGQDDAVTVFRCPGAFELPAVADRVAQTGEFDAIVCLGVLIRGATPHFDYISSTMTSGIARVGLERQVPVSYGVITVESQEQAMERSGSKVGNKGEEAVLAAIEMANLYKQIGE